jgi:hypothetical protein
LKLVSCQTHRTSKNTGKEKKLTRRIKDNRGVRRNVVRSGEGLLGFLIVLSTVIGGAMSVFGLLVDGLGRCLGTKGLRLQVMIHRLAVVH